MFPRQPVMHVLRSMRSCGRTWTRRAGSGTRSRSGQRSGSNQAARPTGQNPAPPPDAARHARGRRRTAPGGCRAAPARPAQPGSPPADTTASRPGPLRPPGPGRTRRRPADNDPRSGPGPPTSSTRPDCPAASRASSSQHAPPRRCFRGGLRPGRSSVLGGIEEFPLFRDPARSAAASCSRRSATIASSAAIC